MSCGILFSNELSRQKSLSCGKEMVKFKDKRIHLPEKGIALYFTFIKLSKFDNSLI